MEVKKESASHLAHPTHLDELIEKARKNTSKSSKFRHLVTTTFIIFTLSGLFGFLLLANIQTKTAKFEEILPTPSTPTPYEKPQSNTLSTDPSNWKTFTNKKHKYSLKYPTSWKIGNIYPTQNIQEADEVNFRETTDQIPAESGISIIIKGNPSNLSITQICESKSESNPEPQGFLCDANMSTQKVDVGVNEWTKHVANSISIPPTGYVLYSKTKGNKIFLIYSLGASEDQVNQILSTLLFLNKN